VAYCHDAAWAYIFRSQLLMLMELNGRNGLIPLADARIYNDQAAAKYKVVYSKYSFAQWMAFVKFHQLLLHRPSDMLEITIREKTS